MPSETYNEVQHNKALSGDLARRFENWVAHHRDFLKQDLDPAGLDLARKYLQAGGGPGTQATLGWFNDPEVLYKDASAAAALSPEQVHWEWSGKGYLQANTTDSALFQEYARKSEVLERLRPREIFDRGGTLHDYTAPLLFPVDTPEWKQPLSLEGYKARLADMVKAAENGPWSPAVADEALALRIFLDKGLRPSLAPYQDPSQVQDDPGSRKAMAAARELAAELRRIETLRQLTRYVKGETAITGKINDSGSRAREIATALMAVSRDPLARERQRHVSDLLSSRASDALAGIPYARQAKPLLQAIRAYAPDSDLGTVTQELYADPNTTGFDTMPVEPPRAVEHRTGRSLDSILNILNTGVLKDQQTLLQEGVTPRTEPGFDVEHHTNADELMSRVFFSRAGTPPAVNDAGDLPLTLVLRESTMRRASGGDPTAPQPHGRQTYWHSARNIGVPGPVDLKEHSGVAVVDPVQIESMIEREALDAARVRASALAAEDPYNSSPLHADIAGETVRLLPEERARFGAQLSPEALRKLPVPTVTSEEWGRLRQQAKSPWGAAIKRALKAKGLLAGAGAVGLGAVGASVAEAAEAASQGARPKEVFSDLAKQSLLNLALQATGDVGFAAPVAARGVEKISQGDLSSPSPRDAVSAGIPAVALGVAAPVLGSSMAALPLALSGVDVISRREAQKWPEPESAEPGWRMQDPDWRRKTRIDRLLGR